MAIPDLSGSDLGSPDVGVDLSGDLTKPDMVEADLNADMALDMIFDMASDLDEDVAPDLDKDMAPDPDLNEDMPPDMSVIPSGLVCFVRAPPTPVCDPVEGCSDGQECKIVFVTGTLDARCTMTTSGSQQEGQPCNPAAVIPECGSSLNCVIGVCRQICRIHDAYGCEPDGPNPACRNEYSQSGFGTCWPDC